MSLVIDRNNELKELREQVQQPAFLRLMAQLISYLFHPLFIPVYLSWVLLKTKPYFFSSLNAMDQRMYIPRFAAMYVLFPLASVLLLRALKFVSSIQLKTQRERIIPYVVCMIYYWWMWYVLRTQNIFPSEAVVLSLSIFLASVGGLLANIYMKVSMHAIGAAIMCSFITLLAFTAGISAGVYLAASLFLAGLVCTCRFIASDHTAIEVYGGFLIGLLCFVIAVLVS